MSYLTPHEARILSEGLGDSWHGNMYANNVEIRTLRETEADQEVGQQDYVLEQIERSREILRPYLGRVAWGTSPWLVMNESGEWVRNYIYKEYTGGWVQHAEGVIKDIEAHTFRIKMYETRFSQEECEFYRPGGGGDLRYGFHVGVVLNPVISVDMGMQQLEPASLPDEVMIPIHTFPAYPNSSLGSLNGKHTIAK